MTRREEASKRVIEFNRVGISGVNGYDDATVP
jgi:hypothetical protein